MKGNNSFKFCPSMMNEIIQHYLDNVMLKEKCIVNIVKQEQGALGTFIVETKAEKEEGK